jgi:hypothetical protein
MRRGPSAAGRCAGRGQGRDEVRGSLVRDAGGRRMVLGPAQTPVLAADEEQAL